MKVILMRPVEHVGEVGDVVDVTDGYGRNFLIPRGFAVAATAKNKRQLEHEQLLREHRIVRARKEAQTLANSCRRCRVILCAKLARKGNCLALSPAWISLRHSRAPALRLTVVTFSSTSRSRVSANLRCQYACWQRPQLS